MEYRVSKYTYQFVSSRNDYLLYCSNSNSFIKLTSDLYDFLKECKEDYNLTIVR